MCLALKQDNVIIANKCKFYSKSTRNSLRFRIKKRINVMHTKGRMPKQRNTEFFCISKLNAFTYNQKTNTLKVFQK